MLRLYIMMLQDKLCWDKIFTDENTICLLENICLLLRHITVVRFFLELHSFINENGGVNRVLNREKQMT